MSDEMIGQAVFAERRPSDPEGMGDTLAMHPSLAAEFMAAIYAEMEERFNKFGGEALVAKFESGMWLDEKEINETDDSTVSEEADLPDVPLSERGFGV